MRASRLLSIAILLQMRGRLPASALAREFEVSVRTIYRDVDALSAAGVPVYAEPGRSGGIALDAGWRTRLTGLTPAEAEALPLAGLGAAARDLGVGSEAIAAQLKMLASLPPDSGASAQRIATRLHLDPVPWYHRAETLACLPALAGAVWRGRRVRIDYESWRGAVARSVDPLGLVQKGGLWYLVAAVAGAPRTYRVANVRRLELLDEPFRRPVRFDLARYWTTWSADFEARLLHARATVRLSPTGMRILRAIAPAAAESAARTARPCAPAGWIEARIPVEGEQHAARELLRLGAEVEVRAPAALQRALLREARAVLARYATR